MKLTELQNQIVNIEKFSENKKHAILSSAGSGKSTVLAERVKHLLKTEDPRNIAVFSFSKSAAKEIINRINNKEVQISTIHSLAYKLFNKKDINIITDTEYLNIFKKFNQDEDESIVSEVVNKITTAKINNVDITKLKQYEIDMYYKVFDWQVKNNIYTYEDLIYYTLRDKTTRFPVYKYIFVDENQDSNKLNIDFIAKLVMPETYLMMFQDIMQTLYMFRGANPFYLMQFIEANNCEIIHLNETFRFGKGISDLAKKVIDKMQINEKYKIITETKQTSQEPNIYITDYETQINHILSDIRVNYQNGVKYKDINILARTNKELVQISEILSANNIPNHTQSGSFLDRSEIKTIINFVELINNFNVMKFIFIVNKLKIGIDKKTIDNVLDSFESDSKNSKSNNKLDDVDNEIDNTIEIFKNDEVSSKNSNIIDVINYAINTKILKIGKVKIEGFQKLKIIFEKIKSILNNPDDFNKIMMIAEAIEIDNMDFMVKKLNNEGVDNNGERWSFIRYFNDNFVRSELNLIDYINNLKLQFSNDDQDEINAVMLRTVHSSKGMTLPYVYLVLNNFCNPRFFNLEDEANLLSEYFCLYVGITRAKEKLNVYMNNNVTKLMFLTNDSNINATEKEYTGKLDVEWFNQPKFVNNSKCNVSISVENVIRKTEKAVCLKVREFRDNIWIPFSALRYNNGNLYTQYWLINQLYEKL